MGHHLKFQDTASPVVRFLICSGVEGFRGSKFIPQGPGGGKRVEGGGLLRVMVKSFGNEIPLYIKR